MWVVEQKGGGGGKEGGGEGKEIFVVTSVTKAMVLDLQPYPQRVLVSLRIPDSPGHWEGGMEWGKWW